MSYDYKYTDGEELFYGPIQDISIDWFKLKNFEEFKKTLKVHNVDATVEALRDCWAYIRTNRHESRMVIKQV